MVSVASYPPVAIRSPLRAQLASVEVQDMLAGLNLSSLLSGSSQYVRVTSDIRECAMEL